MVTKSTHKAEVVPIKLQPHPNADSLSIVNVFDYTICVRTADWVNQNIGIYIVPDSVVDTQKQEFQFLAKNNERFVRIKARKFRGQISYGLLIPAPKDAKIGDDYASVLDITRYEPPEAISTGGEATKPPNGFYPKYDIDSFQRWAKQVLRNEEIVTISEKIDGSSARYIYLDGQLHVSSRTEFKRYDPKNIWWQALEKTPQITEFCTKNPGLTLYGEVFGHVGGMLYGPKRNVRFIAFDIWNGKRYLDFADFTNLTQQFEIPTAPIIYEKFVYEENSIGFLVDLANGPSMIEGANHIREGIVIKPQIERWDENIGRVILKLVSAKYLTR